MIQNAYINASQMLCKQIDAFIVVASVYLIATETSVSILHAVRMYVLNYIIGWTEVMYMTLKVVIVS